MTYTPRPGMVPVSVSPYPPASPPTSAVPVCCTLAGLGVWVNYTTRAGRTILHPFPSAWAWMRGHVSVSSMHAGFKLSVCATKG